MREIALVARGNHRKAPVTVGCVIERDQTRHHQTAHLALEEAAVTGITPGVRQSPLRNLACDTGFPVNSAGGYQADLTPPDQLLHRLYESMA